MQELTYKPIDIPQSPHTMQSRRGTDQVYIQTTQSRLNRYPDSPMREARPLRAEYMTTDPMIRSEVTLQSTDVRDFVNGLRKRPRWAEPNARYLVPV